jgi:hypothetical protein
MNASDHISGSREAHCQSAMRRCASSPEIKWRDEERSRNLIVWTVRLRPSQVEFLQAEAVVVANHDRMKSACQLDRCLASRLIAFDRRALVNLDRRSIIGIVPRSDSDPSPESAGNPPGGGKMPRRGVHAIAGERVSQRSRYRSK